MEEWDLLLIPIFKSEALLKYMYLTAALQIDFNERSQITPISVTNKPFSNIRCIVVSNVRTQLSRWIVFNLPSSILGRSCNAPFNPVVNRFGEFRASKWMSSVLLHALTRQHLYFKQLEWSETDLMLFAAFETAQLSTFFWHSPKQKWK